MSPAKLILLFGGIASVGSVGYFASRHLQCQSLEDDYLNGISAMKSSTLSASIFPEGEVSKALALASDQEMKKAEVALRGLYEQCGNRAAETAARKGTELLLS